MAVGAGVGVGVDVIPIGTRLPLDQESFPPAFKHVYLKPLMVFEEPAFLHGVPFIVVAAYPEVLVRLKAIATKRLSRFT